MLQAFFSVFGTLLQILAKFFVLSQFWNTFSTLNGNWSLNKQNRFAKQS